MIPGPLPELVLASQSGARRDMLTAAGVPFRARAAGVDEDAAKASLAHLGARDLADALSELKALKVSAQLPGVLVLGCDSTVATADGVLLDKPDARTTARAQLRLLAGATHDLYSAAVIARDGAAIWRFVDRARLTIRPLSDAFLDRYLDAEWPAIGGCVGGYRIEGPGAQLFTAIEGSLFTVRGLPLLPLLAQLRVLGVLAT